MPSPETMEVHLRRASLEIRVSSGWVAHITSSGVRMLVAASTSFAVSIGTGGNTQRMRLVTSFADEFYACALHVRKVGAVV